MKISQRLFEAYLKCPTKCWLRSIGEHPTDVAWTQYSESNEQSYRASQIEQMCLRIGPNDSLRSPQADVLKTDGWRLAVDVVAATPTLESDVHAIEFVPADGRRRPAQLSVVRFSAANKLTNHTKMLLQFDELVVSEMLGIEVSRGKVIHGDNRAVASVRASALGLELRKCTEAITSLMASSSPPDLVLIPDCAECEFQTRCRQKAVERDDLSLLSGMTEKERKKLHEKGIFTTTQLSYTFRPRRRPKRLRTAPERYRHALRALAIRQKQIHIVGNPQLQIDGTPVYLDIEGLPDREIYYLIGLRCGSGDSVVEHSLWADDDASEERIWQEFLGILATIENPVLIHYGSYEGAWLKRMGDRYGMPHANSASAKAVKTPINLLSVIFAQVYFPTMSNRLKDIGGYLGATWSGRITSGLESIIYRREWERSHSAEVKTALIRYNRDDCAALEIVTTALMRLIRESEPRPDVEFADNPKQVASAKGHAIHSALNAVLKSAHAKYSRSRIKLASDGIIEAPPRTGRVGTPRPRRRSFSTIKGQIVRVPRKRVCPVDPTHELSRSSKMSQHSVLDLVFTRTGCRKTVIRYTGAMGYCNMCHERYAPPGTLRHRGELFGWNFQAWVVYQRIALRMSYRLIANAAADLFAERLSPQTAFGFIERFAEYHRGTEDRLLRRLMESPIVHLDETKMSISGDDQYVWVFTDGGRVVFRLRPNREAEFLRPLFANFNGAVVTDFYGGYDGLLCKQQKCLVHLIRDLNDELWKHPFDDELEGFVAAVRDLVIPILADVQRFGLRARYLKKHHDSVESFYRQMITSRVYARETTTRFRKRFERYKESLFCFLENNGVPWHNNTAERALRQSCRATQDLRVF